MRNIKLSKGIAVGLIVLLASLWSNASSVGNRIQFWMSMGENISNEEYCDKYKSILDSLDIIVKFPSELIPYSDEAYKVPFVFCPDQDYHNDPIGALVGASMYGPAFTPHSKDALILYPICVDLAGISPDYSIEQEFMCAYAKDSINITDMINVIEKNDITKVSNVDKIISYEYDIKSSKLDGFKYCVGLAFRKKNHYTMLVKILLNDESLKKKDKYTQLISNSVRYGDNPKPEWIEAEKNVRSDEGVFPMEKPIRCIHFH